MYVYIYTYIYILHYIIYIIYILYIYIYIYICITKGKKRKETKFVGTQSTHATFFSLLIITLYRNGTIQWKGITYYMTSFKYLKKKYLKKKI